MKYEKTDDAISRLTPEQFRVTQQDGTERPFTGEYDEHFEPGIMSILSRESRSSPLLPSSTPVVAGLRSPSRLSRTTSMNDAILRMA